MIRTVIQGLKCQAGMKDNLDCDIPSRCENCEHKKRGNIECGEEVAKDALDLILKLQAEIEKLRGN